MKKLLFGFGLSGAIAASGIDVSRLPERSFGPRDVSVADGHEEQLNTDQPRPPLIADTTTVAQIEFRTGSEPLNWDDPDRGTLLAVCRDVPIRSNAIAEGAVSAAPINESGTVRHIRIKDALGRTLFQGPVSETAAPGTVFFDNATCVAGGTVTIWS